jgi:hypothetical protein
MSTPTRRHGFRAASAIILLLGGVLRCRRDARRQRA